ncbi:MAG: TlpA family protein disulfide reductase [Myxococcales bacterium]|nr:TlpA family protein disulfide reductase [Myxococcales bacterium]
MRRFTFFGMLAVALLGLGWMTSTASAGSAQKGFRFPPFKVKYIQAAAPSAKPYLRDFNFTDVVGKIPIAMMYFLPGHKGSEAELQAANATAMLPFFKDKIRFLAITKVNSLKEVKKVFARLQKLKVTLPVLIDDSRGLLAYVTLTRHVPSYSVVTVKGYLRLSNASSLTETVRPGMSLFKALRDVAAHKDIPYTRAPGASPNPLDLVGKKAPAYRSEPALPSIKVTWPTSGPSRAPTILVFWSVGCPHCRKTLPPLDKYAQKNKGRFHLLTYAQVDDDLRKDMLKTFINEHKLQCPVLADAKGVISARYQILKVPTFVLIDPMGVVRDVHSGGGEKIGEALDQMLKRYQASKK